MARGGISNRERGRRASSEATGGRAPFGSAGKTTANHVLSSWRVMLKLQELWQSTFADAVTKRGGYKWH